MVQSVKCLLQGLKFEPQKSCSEARRGDALIALTVEAEAGITAGHTGQLAWSNWQVPGQQDTCLRTKAYGA